MSGFLDRVLPRYPKGAAEGDRVRRPIRRILVIGTMPNASYQYFLAARLKHAGMPPLVERRITESIADIDPDGTYIVFCRYCGFRHLGWIRKHRERIAGAGLFIDDDIKTMIRERGASPVYKAYIFALGYLPLYWYKDLIGTVWVATETLRQTLADADPIVLPLAIEQSDIANAAAAAPERDRPRIAYHSKITIHHRAEFEFVLDVAERLTGSGLAFELEVIGNAGRLPPRLRGNPSITVLPELPFPDYVTHIGRTRYDFMLVPMLPSLVNAVRSANKRVAVARSRACGLYSAGSVFEEDRHPDEIFIKNDPDLWAEQIQWLAQNQDRVERGRAATSKVVDRYIQNAAEGLIGVCTPNGGHSS